MAARVGGEFGISQPAVSQHLKVLRDNGFATVRAEGTRGSTPSTRPACRRSTPGSSSSGCFWDQKLDALGTEIARGKKVAVGSS